MFFLDLLYPEIIKKKCISSNNTRYELTGNTSPGDCLQNRRTAIISSLFEELFPITLAPPVPLNWWRQ